MGLSKTNLFTERQNEAAGMAKVLGHPARIAIIDHLIRSKTCICGDLVEELGLAQATISQHLQELKAAGLIKGTVEGASVCYCIDLQTWKRFKDFFNLFFTDIEVKDICC